MPLANEPRNTTRIVAPEVADPVSVEVRSGSWEVIGVMRIEPELYFASITESIIIGIGIIGVGSRVGGGNIDPGVVFHPVGQPVAVCVRDGVGVCDNSAGNCTRAISSCSECRCRENRDIGARRAAFGRGRAVGRVADRGPGSRAANLDDDRGAEGAAGWAEDRVRNVDG